MDAAAHRFPFERNSYRRYIRRGISSLTRLRGGETKVDEEGDKERKVGVDRESKVSNSLLHSLFLGQLARNTTNFQPSSPFFTPVSTSFLPSSLASFSPPIFPLYLFLSLLLPSRSRNKPERGGSRAQNSRPDTN